MLSKRRCSQRCSQIHQRCSKEHLTHDTRQRLKTAAQQQAGATDLTAFASCFPSDPTVSPNASPAPISNFSTSTTAGGGGGGGGEGGMGGVGGGVTVNLVDRELDKLRSLRPDLLFSPPVCPAMHECVHSLVLSELRIH
jgi:hypothetical protein